MGDVGWYRRKAGLGKAKNATGLRRRFGRGRARPRAHVRHSRRAIQKFRNKAGFRTRVVLQIKQLRRDVRSIMSARGQRSIAQNGQGHKRVGSNKRTCVYCCGGIDAGRCCRLPVMLLRLRLRLEGCRRSLLVCCCSVFALVLVFVFASVFGFGFGFGCLQLLSFCRAPCWRDEGRGTRDEGLGLGLELAWSKLARHPHSSDAKI